MSAVLEYQDVLPGSGTPGTSKDAATVGNEGATIYRWAKETTATSAVKSELFDLAADNALVSSVTLKYAVDFAVALPLDLAQPEVSVDPDGEIAFDWIDENNNMLSVSIGPAGGITYAGKVQAQSASGTEQFGGSIPRMLRAALENFRITR